MRNQPGRIVVPTAQRSRRAHNNRQAHKPEGIHRSLVDAAIVIGTTLVTTLVLLMISGQLHDTTAGNLITQSSPPVPIISLSPSPGQSPQPAPSPRFTTSAASPTPAATPVNEGNANVTDDATIQAAIDKKLQDSAEFASLNVTATVTAGKVVVVGSVPSDELREKIEKLLRAVKGVHQVDNQIAVVTDN